MGARARRHLGILGIATIALGLGSSHATGKLDPSFGGLGKVTTDVLGQDDAAEDLAIQPDGKIIAVGNSENPSNGQYVVALVRYLADGALDKTFGAGDGKVVTDLGNSFTNAIALQPDGKIVVVGGVFDQQFSNGDFVILRYNTDGSADVSFGDGDGIVLTDFGSHEVAFDVALEPEGRILVSGRSGPNPTNSGGSAVALARYDEDGSLDASLDGDGTVTTAMGDGIEVRTVALQPDDRIVVAGQFVDGDSYGGAVLRYQATGLLDPSFNGDGRLGLEAVDWFDAVAVQPDGRIVAVGYAIVGEPLDSHAETAVVRFNATGALDPTFSSKGIATIDAYHDSFGSDVDLQPNGKILVAGRASGGAVTGSTHFFAARLLTDGALDPSFNGVGKLATSFGSYASATSAVLQRDGRIVLAGATFDGAWLDFALARYAGDAPVSPGLVRGNAWRLSNDLDADGDIPWFELGKASDRPIVGDWDGDDDETPGVVRGNVWYLTNASPPQSVAHTFSFASASDRPVAGDWDGNGTWTPAAVRGNVWYVTNANPPTSIAHTFTFAKASDRPVAGDWDGNGAWTPGVVRGNTWYVSNQMPPQTVESFQFGKATDFPVVGDWDGDGAWTPGVVRGNVWYLTNEIAPESIYANFVFGKTTDRFVVGDWDVL